MSRGMLAMLMLLAACGVTEVRGDGACSITLYLDDRRWDRAVPVTLHSRSSLEPFRREGITTGGSVTFRGLPDSFTKRGGFATIGAPPEVECLQAGRSTIAVWSGSNRVDCHTREGT